MRSRALQLLIPQFCKSGECFRTSCPSALVHCALGYVDEQSDPLPFILSMLYHIDETMLVTGIMTVRVLGIRLVLILLLDGIDATEESLC